MPSVRIDWSSIKEKLDDVTALYLLTHRQASLILSNIENLEWKATFRDFDYDYSDYDELQLEVADLHHNLTMPVNLVDIIPLIDEIEDLLRALNQHAQCCDGNTDPSNGRFYTDTVTDGVGDVPQNIIDAGYAEDEEDWEGFADYKCMIANLIVDHLEWSLRELLKHMDSTGLIIGGIGTIAAIIGSIIATGGLAIVIGILASVAAAATVSGGILKLLDTGTEDLADAVNENRDELICAVYQADGIDGAVIALKDKIDELFTDTEALVLKNLNIEPSLRGLYAGRYNQIDIAEQLAEQGYETTEFTCNCAYSEYYYKHNFLSDLDGTLLSVAVFDGSQGQPVGSIRIPYTPTSAKVYHTSNSLRTRVGIGDSAGLKLWIKKVSFDYFMISNFGSLRLICTHDGGSEIIEYPYQTTWTHVDKVFTPILESTSPTTDIVRLSPLGNGTSNYCWIDNLEIWFDAEV